MALNASGQLQINLQVPMERNASLASDQYGGYKGSLQLQFWDAAGKTIVGVSDPFQFPAFPMWGGFFTDANGYAIAQHASDFTPVTVQNPAHAGETLIAYGDDFFPVLPAPAIGFPTPAQPLFQRQIFPFPFASSFRTNSTLTNLYLQAYPSTDICPPQIAQPSCSFTNTPAVQVNFAGLAPGQVGVEQINFVVPANQQPGDWALFYNYGSCADGTGGRCGLTGYSSPFVKIPVR